MTQTASNTAMQMSTQMQKCIAMCNETHSMCEQTMTYALRKGGHLAERDVVMMLMDCAEISRMCADMMMRQSGIASRMCRMCAEVCMSCAEMCSRIDDQTMKMCADACRRSAEMCLQMADGPM